MDTGESFLREGEVPPFCLEGVPVPLGCRFVLTLSGWWHQAPKGNRVNIPEPECGGGFGRWRQRKRTRRRRREPREELSFLLDGVCSLESGWPEIGSSDSGIAPHLSWRPVRSRRPLKIRGKRSKVGSVLSHPVVPITAAGLQGEQPLVDRTM